jgi:hypothetical protein
MNAPPSHLTRTRLEKAAIDNGFDQSVPVGDLAPGWLGFASTKAPLWIWLAVDAAGCPVVALSQSKVAAALGSMVRPTDTPIPLGARAVVGVPDMPSLHGVVRRAFQLARALPDEPLRRFVSKTSALPRSTEVERLVVQRIGQDVFRDAVLEYWEGRCAVTGLGVPTLLRASHIKPWSDCESDAERLDVFNGLLLAPHLDALFDAGFVTFGDDGALVISAELDADAQRCLGLHVTVRLNGLADRHRGYLAWHRERVYRAGFR